MPRFAILAHDSPVLHWDLLLEHGTTCRTWRLDAPLGGVAEIAAVSLPDHRLMYLDYEGPVSRNRGTVLRWDQGRFVWITATEQHIAVLLNGGRWTGRLDLIHNESGWRVMVRPKNETGRTTPA